MKDAIEHTSYQSLHWEYEETNSYFRKDVAKATADWVHLLDNVLQNLKCILVRLKLVKSKSSKMEVSSN